MKAMTKTSLIVYAAAGFLGGYFWSVYRWAAEAQMDPMLLLTPSLAMALVATGLYAGLVGGWASVIMDCRTRAGNRVAELVGRRQVAHAGAFAGINGCGSDYACAAGNALGGRLVTSAAVLFSFAVGALGIRCALWIIA